MLRLAWHNDSARLFSSDAKAAGQVWERASWLCPLPTPEPWRRQIHAWGQSLRLVWPLWWIYPAKAGRGQFVLARGDKLVAAEMKIAVEALAA